MRKIEEYGPIELTNENIKDLSCEKIMFVSFAEAGAMGEPGGILILQKDTTLYHTNYCYGSDVEFEKVKEVFSPLKTFRCEFCQVTNLDDGWQWLDLGVGNYLIIKEALYDEFIDAIPEEIKKSEYSSAILYSEWLNIAKRILKK